MKLQSLRVKNFSAFKDAEFNFSTPLSVLIGENGVGKSSFFQVLEFFQIAIRQDVILACDHFGGFDRLRSHGAEDSIEIYLSLIEGKDYWYYVLKINQD